MNFEPNTFIRYNDANQWEGEVVPIRRARFLKVSLDTQEETWYDALQYHERETCETA